MANIIRHKRNSTASTVPTSGALATGELAINTADGKLFLKKDDNTIVQVGNQPAGSSGQVQVHSTTGTFYADGGLVYDKATAGFETLRVGSGSGRFLNIRGRVETGSGASAIHSNNALDIEAVNGNTITIGDASANYDGTKIVVDNTDISFLGATTVNIDSPTITLTQGSLSLGASAIISASTATAKALKSVVPAGTGITPTIQIICPSANFTLLNQTATQPVFNTPQDTITLQASTTYMFDGQYLLTNGTTSHTTLLSFVLTTATITNCTWTTQNANSSAVNTVVSGMSSVMFNSVAGGAVNGGSGGANTIIRFQGIMRVNAGGTLVPNIAFGTAPSGTNITLVGSYIKFYPIGSNTIDFVGTAIG